jgi:peptidoglycan/LPS O-acetylase OafA/YrhL
MASPMDRRSDLDGLRGIAILLTVFLHYVARSGYFGPFSPPPLASLLDSFWSGVDIFFVLSGFLIGGIVLDHGTAPNFLRAFYVRRALRILPVAYLTIAVAYWLLPLAAPSLARHGDVPPYAFVLFISNLWTSNTATPYPPLAPMWSLAIEEQFYIVAPALLLYARASARIPALVAIIGLSPIVRSFDLGLSIWDYPLFRLDGLCAGVLVAILVRNETFSGFVRRHAREFVLVTAGLVSIMLFFAMFPPTSTQTQIAWGIWLNTLAAAAVILYLHFHRASMLSRALSARPLVIAGRLSYFTYLVHMPVLIVIAHQQSWKPPSWQMPVIAFAVTSALAWVSWRFMESPLIQLGRRFAYAENRVSARMNALPDMG